MWTQNTSEFGLSGLANHSNARVWLNPIINNGFWLGFMVLLQLIDAFATQVFVSKSMVQEGNPLMAQMISNGGFLTFKILGVLICALLVVGLYRVFPNVAKMLNVFIVIFYGSVLLWNVAAVV
jgi:hypothetical protein